MARHSSSLGRDDVSRRTVLKGLGVALGAGALQAPVWRFAEAGSGPPPSRCYIYLDHAARDQWVLGALLVGDPRLPRQVLRRTKRARLPTGERQMPEVEARRVSDDFKRYFYQLLAREKGFRKGLGQGAEAYGIHLDRAALAGVEDRAGRVQLQMLVALLDACRLARFREIFVYYNLPGLKGLSHKQVRDAILKQTRRHRDAGFEVWAHRAVRRAGDRSLVDEGIQAADFVTHALFQEHQYGNDEWLRAIRRLVRRDIDAALLPGIQRLLR